MHINPNWPQELKIAITVTDADGVILDMNDQACQTFASDGGAALIGKNVFDCHPEPALTRTRQLYAQQTANHYTIQKKGVRKIIHQLPWTKDGEFAGFVELSIPLPNDLPHFDRG